MSNSKKQPGHKIAMIGDMQEIFNYKSLLKIYKALSAAIENTSLFGQPLAVFVDREQEKIKHIEDPHYLLFPTDLIRGEIPKEWGVRDSSIPLYWFIKWSELNRLIDPTPIGINITINKNDIISGNLTGLSQKTIITVLSNFRNEEPILTLTSPSVKIFGEITFTRFVVESSGALTFPGGTQLHGVVIDCSPGQNNSIGLTIDMFTKLQVT